MRIIMNKYSLIKILFILLIAIPSTLYALDITAGATTWVAWGSRFENVHEDSKRRNNTYAFDPTVLYGPALSIKFNDDFNLTFVYLFGKFNYVEKIYSDAAGDYFATSRAVRSDSDLALNYRLSNYFKVFAGVKYMAYEVKISFNDVYTNTPCDNHSKHTSIGPGLGVSSTYPITGNLFLLGTVSGFYLFSAGESFVDNKVYSNSSVNLTIGYNEYGINSTVAAAYYVAEISTVISLGCRFQYFVIKYNDYKPFFLINSIENKIYGITLTATYTFSIF